MKAYQQISDRIDWIAGDVLANPQNGQGWTLTPFQIFAGIINEKLARGEPRPVSLPVSSDFYALLVAECKASIEGLPDDFGQNGCFLLAEVDVFDVGRALKLR